MRLGAGLYALDPACTDPAAEHVTLEMTGPTTFVIGPEHGTGSTGETLEFTLGDDGRVRTMRGSSGLSWHPIDAYAEAVAAGVGVNVGSPLRPAGIR